MCEVCLVIFGEMLFFVLFDIDFSMDGWRVLVYIGWDFVDGDCG